jgi:hypothetical protein
MMARIPAAASWGATAGAAYRAITELSSPRGTLFFLPSGPTILLVRGLLKFFKNYISLSTSYNEFNCLAHSGFKLTWNATSPVCGGTVTGQTHGSIKSPGNS